MSKEILKQNNFYKTHDLALAGAITLWYPLEAIDKQNPTKAEFIFPRDEKLDELIELYWRGELRVNPLAYFNQLKTIKSRLYSNK